jgi:hypothetical protein
MVVANDVPGFRKDIRKAKRKPESIRHATNAGVEEHRLKLEWL